ncbi:MAG: hypothetical protein RL648_155 [Verrucomicrobiota bacterium]|jgi:uncharacterized alkaline shock family protein YloU
MLEHDSEEKSSAHELLQEDSGLGSIRINNEVVAHIVAMAAREIPGVVGLASGGLKQDIAGLFGGRKETGAAVNINETPAGAYHIRVKLILTFGVQLAKVAQSVQEAIRDQVENMTNKDVGRVDVIVDGIKREAPEAETIADLE